MLIKMPSLTLDPSYSDSCSDCGSSNSSFSFGVSTPASSIQFSAAPSRRQSIASEAQSYPESAFDRMPNYSSDGTMTPLKTPPPLTYSLGPQGYDADFSSMFSQQHQETDDPSMSSGLHLHEGFVPQSLCFDTSGVAGFDSDIFHESRYHEATERGQRSMDSPETHWSNNFNQDIFQTQNQFGSVQTSSTFDYATIVRLNADDIQHGQASSHFADFSQFTDMMTEANQPRTVAPEQTITYSDESYMPAASSYPLLETPSRTPELESKDNICSSPTVSPLTPLTHPPEQEDPKKRGLLAWKHEASEEEQDIKRIPLKRICRNRQIRDSSARLKLRLRGRSRHVGSITVHEPVEAPHSKTKKHRCDECGIRFDRPEHHKRHKNSIEHIQRCRDLGFMVNVADPKPFKCKVPKCKIAVEGVTRRDNLKPHYQKTHFFIEDVGKEHRKRNIHVTEDYARDVLGLGEWDDRNEQGREWLRMGKPPRIDPCKYD